MDIKSMPEIGNDAAVQTLLETFGARLVSAETESHYIGNLTTRVQIGEDEFVTLPTVRLEFAESKAALERARATMFATYLLHQGRETARELWMKAKPYEGPQFMAWVKLDIEWKRGQEAA